MNHFSEARLFSIDDGRGEDIWEEEIVVRMKQGDNQAFDMHVMVLVLC